MPKIKWDKSDVIAKFQEAVTSILSPQLSKSAGQGLADKFRDITAKRKAEPGAVVPPVTS